jgi:NAD(P)-dependent dehydrogenase (short-subunit alcohol dehydrogenase family)
LCTPVAFVTGSGRGIGKAIVLRLARDGLDIAVNDIEANRGLAESTANEVQALGRKAIVVIAGLEWASPLLAQYNHWLNFFDSGMVQM